MQSFFFIDKRIWWQTIGFAWFFCFMVYLNLLGLGAFVSEVTVLCGILWSLMVWKRFHVSIIVLALLLSALLKRRKFPVFSFSYNGDAPSLLTDKSHTLIFSDVHLVVEMIGSSIFTFFIGQQGYVYKQTNAKNWCGSGQRVSLLLISHV